MNLYAIFATKITVLWNLIMEKHVLAVQVLYVKNAQHHVLNVFGR